MASLGKTMSLGRMGRSLANTGFKTKFQELNINVVEENMPERSVMLCPGIPY